MVALPNVYISWIVVTPISANDLTLVAERFALQSFHSEARPIYIFRVPFPKPNDCSLIIDPWHHSAPYHLPARKQTHPQPSITS